MKNYAWSEAARQRDITLSESSSRGSGDTGDAMTDRYLRYMAQDYDFASGECFFCGNASGARTTGYLPHVGAIYKHKGQCQKEYEEITK